MITTRVGELRHDLLESGQDGASLAKRHGDIELVKTTLQRRPGELYTLRTGYLGAGARHYPLVRIEEFLEEFFARTEANELEFLAGFAGEASQSSRQVRDPNRLTHVEHQDVAVPAEDITEPDRHAAQLLPGPGCENQFSHSLGAAHDVRRVHRLVGRNHHE